MQKFRFTVVTFAIVALVAVCMAAGVNGIFNHVTSAHGYQVTGSTGSVGQGICTSDGTNFDTFCNVGPGSLFYQTVDAAGTPVTQRSALNFGTGFVLSDSSSPSRTTVTLAGTALTSGTNGFYEILSNGTIVNHLNISSIPNDNSYHDYTLPHAFSVAEVSWVCSVDRPGGNPGPLGVTSGSSLSSVQILSNTGGSGTLQNVSCVVTGH